MWSIGRASFPGCRFACLGLCAGWAFSPPCGAGLAGLGMGAGIGCAYFLCCSFVMLLPFQGAGLAACVFPRVSLRLPWAMCWLGFQPALWCGVCGMGAWVRASDVRLFRVVALLRFCPFRAQDWRRASFPGCRFACPGLCAALGFQPALWLGVCGMGHGCGHRTCVFPRVSLRLP